MSLVSRIFNKTNQILAASKPLLFNNNTNNVLKRGFSENFNKPPTNVFIMPKLQEGDSFYGVHRLEQFRKNSEFDRKKFFKQATLDTRLDLTLDPLRDLGNSDGDQRLQEIRYWLNNLGEWVRSPDQIIFHEAFIVACLPHIYGKDWSNAGARVLREMGLSHIDYEVLCQTPRRFGKTTSVGMFSAVVGYVCKGLKIAIFSTGSRASKGMVDQVLKFMKYLPGGMERKIKHSKEELMFSGKSLGIDGGPGSRAAKTAESADDTTSIKSYPCSVDSEYIIILNNNNNTTDYIVILYVCVN